MRKKTGKKTTSYLKLYLSPPIPSYSLAGRRSSRLVDPPIAAYLVLQICNELDIRAEEPRIEEKEEEEVKRTTDLNHAAASYTHTGFGLWLAQAAHKPGTSRERKRKTKRKFLE